MIGLSLGDVIALALATTLFVSLLLGVRYAIEVLPFARSRRERLRGLFGVIVVVLGLSFLFAVAARVFRPDVGPEGIEWTPGSVAYQLFTLVAMGIVIATSWFAIRDLMGGVILKAGRALRVGDRVRVGDVDGRVTAMGLRAVVIETPHGEEAVVPYSRVARESVVRAPTAGRGVAHVFELGLAAPRSLSDVRHRVREGALLCHWAALDREPSVRALDGDRVEVTVFVLHPDRTREIEDAVRARVDG
ncbi:MAG: mechanosensitive ion channel domain-containing protein [Sandaracinaceae bacterium]